MTELTPCMFKLLVKIPIPNYVSLIDILEKKVKISQILTVHHNYYMYILNCI